MRACNCLISRLTSILILIAGCAGCGAGALAGESLSPTNDQGAYDGAAATLNADTGDGEAGRAPMAGPRVTESTPPGILTFIGSPGRGSGALRHPRATLRMYAAALREVELSEAQKSRVRSILRRQKRAARADGASAEWRARRARASAESAARNGNPERAMLALWRVLSPDQQSDFKRRFDDVLAAKRSRRMTGVMGGSPDSPIELTSASAESMEAALLELPPRVRRRLEARRRAMDRLRSCRALPQPKPPSPAEIRFER